MRCIRILFTAVFLLASVVLFSASVQARPVIPAADPPLVTCNLKLATCNSQPAICNLQSDKCELLDDPDAHLSGALESMLRLHCGRVDLSGADRLGGNEPRESRVPAQANDVLVNEPAMDTGDSTTQSEVSLAVRPSDGRLCAVWNDSSDYLTTGSFNGFAYSDDGGLTWHDQGPLPTRSSGYVENWGDPGIKVDSDGTFYYSTMVATWGGSVGVGVARSDDGCQSFSAPVVAHAGSDVDKPLMTVDAHPASPYVDNIYVAWVDFGAGERPYFARSTDGGAAWSVALNLCPGCWGGQQAPILSTAPDGDLYVAWLNYTGAGAHDRSISVVRSADGGVSFGDPVRVVNFNRSYEPGATSSCNRDALNGDVRYADFPSLDITSDGVLHILYSADPDATGSGDAADVYYTRSLDDGLTWSSPVRINDDAGLNDQFFPTIEANPNSMLTAYWYDRRADVHNLEYEIYKAFSYNGGRSWSENVLVSDEPSPIPTINPNFDPIVATCYMADYNLGDSDDDYVYLTWSDNRLVQNGHPDPDVWFEKEPLPEAPPSISLAPEYLSAQGCPGATLRRTLTLTNELGFEETFTLTAVISDPVAAPWLSVQPIPPTIRLSDGERGNFEAVAQIMAPAPPNAAAWVTVTAVAQSDPFYFDDAGVEVRVSPAEDFGLVLRKAIQGDHGGSGRATTVGAGLRARPLRQGDHGGSPLQFALPGQPLTYTLALTNTGLCTLTQVVISDVIPSLVVTDAVASDILITDTHANPPYVWDLENLSHGAGGLITISGFISPSLVTDTIILNEARISALPDLASTDQSAQASVSVEVPRVYFSSTLYSVLENAAVAPIAIRLNVPNPYADVGVDYVVLRDGGSATGDSDYVVASGTLTIPAGSLSAAFDVTILDDALDEVDESVLLQLRDPRSSCPYSPMAATLFIIDDDMGSVVVDPISLTVSERLNFQPSGSAAFTLTLGSAPTAPVAIDLSASNDECRAAVTGSATPVVTLTHDNWEGGLGVKVVAVDDALHDGDQTCIIQTAASRSDDPDYDGLDPPDVTVTVRDDDLPPLADFTLSAQPTSLLADGVSTSTLTVTAADVTGDGAPFAGRVVTLALKVQSWPISGSATTVTLDAAGVAMHTYTAYTSTGTVVFTATLMDYGAPQVATTTIQLTDNPLRGEIYFEMGRLITYTFVVSNVHPLDSHFNLVMTGSVPANCRLVQSQRLNQSSNAQGYVEARLPELPPGESYTLSWTVEPVLVVGDIEAQAHAVSDSAAQRLTLWSRIYRLLLVPVFKNFDF